MAQSDFEKRWGTPGPDQGTDDKQTESQKLPGSLEADYNVDYRFKPEGNPSYTTEDYSAATAGGGGGGGKAIGGSGGGGGGSGGGGDGDFNDGEPGDYNTARMGTMLLAFLMFVGGGFGYAKKGSTKSAVAGGVIGVTLLVAGCLMGDPSFAVLGVKLALATCVATAIAMGYRINKTSAFKESGTPTPSTVVLGVCSLYALVYITAFNSVLL